MSNEPRAPIPVATGPDGLAELTDRYLDEGLRAAFAEESVARIGPEVRSPEKASDAGKVIAGRYRLLELIGEGGMGSVWLAEQREPVRRMVALKLIKAGMDSRSLIGRFNAERQALALMDHPNIAKVLDGGVSESGQPYFVMELVKGLPITRFCDETKLSPRERLELFLPVCEAIQHAHQKGIIHRDIKPSNVMVALYDDKPVPKVIDFGVAKAMGSLHEDTFHTGFGMVVGTPEYMSPEQATLNNHDIDTRSDVYSLGVLLYELLAGAPPFRRSELQQAGLVEILRIVREVEPPRPSFKLSTDGHRANIAVARRCEPAVLQKILRGDLDWIVMKSLEKQRARRYASALELASDLGRYLRNDAVEARPPSRIYRLTKFVARNRAAVMATVVAFLLLLASTIFSAWQSRRATLASRVARQNEQVASRNATLAGEAMNQERLARAAEKQQREAAEEQQRAALVERDKAVRARNSTREVLDLMTSGLTEQFLTRQESLTTDQKAFLGQVLQYYTTLASESGDDEEGLFAVASACERIGLLHFRLGNLSEATNSYRQARERLAGLLAGSPGHPEAQLLYCEVFNRLAMLLNQTGFREESRETFRLGIAECNRMADLQPDHYEYSRLLATLEYNQALQLRDDGALEDFERQARASLGRLEELTRRFPGEREHVQLQGINATNLGLYLAANDEFEAGRLLMENGEAILERRLEEHPDDPRARRTLAWCLHNLGIQLGRHGEGQAAREQLLRSQTLMESLVREFPGNLEYGIMLATVDRTLAWQEQLAGRLPEARDCLQRSVDLLTRQLRDQPGHTDCRFELGESHLRLAEFQLESGESSAGLLNLNQTVLTWSRLLNHPDDLQLYHERYATIADGFALASGAFPGRREEFWRTALRSFRKNRGLADDAGLPDLPHSLLICRQMTGAFWTGSADESLARLRETIAEREWNAGATYNFACAFAIAAGRFADQRETHSVEAVGLLRQATGRGWNKRAHAESDEDLEILRERPDFRQWLDSLRPPEPAGPPPPGQ